MDAGIEGHKIKRSRNQKLTDNLTAELARDYHLIVAQLDKVKADQNAPKAATRKRRAPIMNSIVKKCHERDTRKHK